MKLIETKLGGVYIIENNIFKDNRGVFIKTFNADNFKEKGLCSQFCESYYSISNKGVVRGMHFQLKPFDHEKLVYVAKGRIMDVILDIRQESKTYGDYIEVELSENNARSVYIPKGLAHGFKALEDGTITIYNVSTGYHSESDNGILWNSFGCDWGTSQPIISSRDQTFAKFEDYKNTF